MLSYLLLLAFIPLILGPNIFLSLLLGSVRYLTTEADLSAEN